MVKAILRVTKDAADDQAAIRVINYYRHISPLRWEQSFQSALRPKRPKLGALNRMADYLGLELRKRIKALAGDYDAEIQRLYSEGRYRAAQWNKWLAWGYAGFYVLRAPIDWLSSFVIAKFTGR
jgi:hypothetical protein